LKESNTLMSHNTGPLQPSYFGEESKATLPQKQAEAPAKPTTAPTKKAPPKKRESLTKQYPHLAAIANKLATEEVPLDKLRKLLRDADSAAEQALSKSNEEFNAAIQRTHAVMNLLARRSEEQRRLYGEILRELVRREEVQKAQHAEPRVDAQ
jgi:hypothetical protein